MSPPVFSISELQLQPFSVIGDGSGSGLGWKVPSLSDGPQRHKLGGRRRDGVAQGSGQPSQSLGLQMGIRSSEGLGHPRSYGYLDWGASVAPGGVGAPKGRGAGPSGRGMGAAGCLGCPGPRHGRMLAGRAGQCSCTGEGAIHLTHISQVCCVWALF